MERPPRRTQAPGSRGGPQPGGPALVLGRSGWCTSVWVCSSSARQGHESVAGVHGPRSRLLSRLLSDGGSVPTVELPQPPEAVEVRTGAPLAFQLGGCVFGDGHGAASPDSGAMPAPDERCWTMTTETRSETDGPSDGGQSSSVARELHEMGTGRSAESHRGQVWRRLRLGQTNVLTDATGPPA